jgi:hypothetical protein
MVGAALLFALPPCVRACASAATLREASSADIRAFVQDKGMTLLTFVGYSGAGYEDVPQMLAHASRVLDKHDPAGTMVNIGATATGIGAVYELAKRRGFLTIGIVSSLAREGGEPLSPCVDAVFFVHDDTWGGRQPGSAGLAPTSAAVVTNNLAIVGIGGGEIARDEMQAARAAGKPVSFIAADMNHRIARDKALAKGQAEPADFRGAAGAAFVQTP